MWNNIRCFAFLLVTVAAFEVHAIPTEMSKEDEAKLQKGEIFSSSEKMTNSSVMLGKSVIFISDIPEAVFYVLWDIEKYKHFIPRVKDSRVTQRSKNQTLGVIETDLPWPVKDCWVYAQFDWTQVAPRTFEIKWFMKNGNMRRYEGKALIKPFSGNPNQTLLYYQLLAEPQTAAPDSIISNGIKAVARTIAQHIKLRLSALRKFKKLPASL